MEPDNKKTKEDDFDNLQRVIRDLKIRVINATSTPPNEQTPKKIDEKIRRIKIENDNAESDQQLKTVTLQILFLFLAAETVAVFFLAFFQGFNAWGFHLDVWSFRLLITATISQITAMLLIAVHHLFPAKHKR